MTTRLAMIGLILLALAFPVFSQDTPSKPEGKALMVRSVRGAQAVLETVTTRESVTVKVGDPVEGWTVVGITPLGVELERKTDRGRKIRMQLAAPPSLVTPSPPRP